MHLRYYFNPRSPRGLRHLKNTVGRNRNGISIHAAQEGCDGTDHGVKRADVISIHAAQEGCDFCAAFHISVFAISIHAAQEGCDSKANKKYAELFIFQSTQPKRAATIMAVIQGIEP